jgi:hypothetical protein
VSGSSQNGKGDVVPPGSKPGSHLGLREVMLWPGSLAAIQDTGQAHLELETRQAHLRLETRQAQGWKYERSCDITMAVNLEASRG